MKITKEVVDNRQVKEITEEQLKSETGLSISYLRFVHHNCYEDCINNIFYYLEK